VDCVGDVVEVGLEWEEVLGVEMIVCVKVTVELGEGGGEGGDEGGRDTWVGERIHVV
jgi:hypothetical protein